MEVRTAAGLFAMREDRGAEQECFLAARVEAEQETVRL